MHGEILEYRNVDPDGQEDAMDPEFEEDVEHWPTDTLVLGKSSWRDGADKALKYAWPDKNGKRARGGEIPIVALPQAVIFASKHGYLSTEQVQEIAKGLIDVLATHGGPGLG